MDVAAGVVLEPAADPSAAPRVLRLKVELPSGLRESASALGLGLYEGELGSYYLRRIEKRDLPATLLERRVPSLTWAEADGGVLVLCPAVPLAPGSVYSLASPALGLVTTVQVREAGTAPLLRRVWPPPDAGTGARHPIYCADGGAPTRSIPVVLDPGHLAGRLVPGVGASGAAGGACVHVVSQGLPDGGTVVPPPRVGALALDPAPLRNGVPPAPVGTVCGAGEIRIGPGCAEVEDDRMVVRSPDTPMFWAVVTSGSLTLDVAGAGARFVVRGLTPSTIQQLDVSAIDVAGREQHSRPWLSTAATRAHIVLNEVLANPLGPEPAEEWVELVNDGGIAVDLGGWVLADIGGETVLPSHLLEPGAFALVVREDFVEDDGLDVATPPGLALLRVPAIGSHGLSNTGEPLELRDLSGRVVSRFPAAPRPKPGISVARRSPWSIDADPRAFGLSGGQGASPGQPNQLRP